MTVHDARVVIDAAGGLASQAGLARRWDISRQRVSEMAQHPDFPTPLRVDEAGKVYVVAEAQSFRDTVRRSGPR